MEKPDRPAPPESKNDPEKRLLRAHKEITMGVEEISPELAMDILGRQTDNRPICDRRVEHYRRQIEEGRWQINGQTIVFDWFDRLIDGQHRLWAIHFSEKRVKLCVVRGVDPATFVTIDTGDPRNAQDILGIRGEVNAVVLAGLCRFIWRWELFEKYRPILYSRRGERKAKDEAESPISKRWATTLTPSPWEIDEVINHHPSARKWAAKASNPLVPKVPLSFVLWWLDTIGVKEADILEFRDKLVNGTEMKAVNPVYRCHKRFLQARMGKTAGRRAIGTLEAAALMIKAWNADREGREASTSMWRGDEVFPEPHK